MMWRSIDGKEHDIVKQITAYPSEERRKETRKRKTRQESDLEEENDSFDFIDD